jgi:hypothetical protein
MEKIREGEHLKNCHNPINQSKDKSEWYKMKKNGFLSSYKDSKLDEF